MAEQTNHNQAGEVAPSTVNQQAPTVAEQHAPSTDSPEATDIPTANAPEPKAANPETNPNAATTTTAPPKREKPAAAAKGADGDKPAAAKAGKKEKAPALEDKPFADFIQQDYLPALQKAIAQQGVNNLQLSFVKQKVSIKGMDQLGECWQIVGNFPDGVRHFHLYFPDENIQGKKGFSCYEGRHPSTLESFLIDERKITLDLLVYGLMQRLNGQKWLGRN